MEQQQGASKRAYCLGWPLELAAPAESTVSWSHAGSNICLDFQGDPLNAGLAVYFDGNHHMALDIYGRHGLIPTDH